jgi:predicted CopG family antitoxin
MKEIEQSSIYNQSLFATAVKLGIADKDSPLFIQNLVMNRVASFINQYKTINGKISETLIIGKFNSEKDKIIEAFTKTYAFSEAFYEEAYVRLKKYHRENNSWQDLFTEIVEEESHFCEIFVRLIEEETGKLITSPEQLQKVTGIYEINGTWEGDQEISKELKKQTMKALATAEIEDTFARAMEHRYYEVLTACLKTGGKYKDLLEIKPSLFYLGESYQEETIKKVLCIYYSLWDPTDIRPDIKTIAEAIEAPYSVVLSAKTN